MGIPADTSLRDYVLAVLSHQNEGVALEAADIRRIYKTHQPAASIESSLRNSKRVGYAKYVIRDDADNGYVITRSGLAYLDKLTTTPTISLRTTNSNVVSVANYEKKIETLDYLGAILDPQITTVLDDIADDLKRANQ